MHGANGVATVEVVTTVQRRRWSLQDKLRLIEGRKAASAPYGWTLFRGNLKSPEVSTFDWP